MNVLLAVAFVFCWSSGFIGAKLGAGSASVLTILMWRFLPLATILVGITVALPGVKWRAASIRDIVVQAMIGLLSQSGYLLAVYWAIQLGVSSGTTSLIDATQPLVASAFVGPLLGQRVSGKQWLGLCLGISGVGIVTSADAALAEGVAWWAYLVPFLGMLSLVAATFLERRSRARVAPGVSLTVHCTTSAIIFTLLALCAGVAVPPSELSFWGAIAWLVALSTFGGYGLYWLLLSRAGVTEVNTLMFLMAPVTAVWGALMFGEPFGLQTALGLCVGLVAVLVVNSGGVGARDVSAGQVQAASCQAC